VASLAVCLNLMSVTSVCDGLEFQFIWLGFQVQEMDSEVRGKKTANQLLHSFTHSLLFVVCKALDCCMNFDVVLSMKYWCCSAFLSIFCLVFESVLSCPFFVIFVSLFTVFYHFFSAF